MSHNVSVRIVVTSGSGLTIHLPQPSDGAARAFQILVHADAPRAISPTARSAIGFGTDRAAGREGMNSDRSRTVIAWAILGWTLAATAARAIREPNAFAQAHWLLDYRFGVMKRGLIGSLGAVLTGVFGRQMTPRLILACSAVALFGMFAGMLVLLYRSAGRHAPKDDALAAGVVFVSSSFVVMNAHLLGYLDAFLYLFAIASVALTLNHRPFLGAFVSSVAMLAHESYILIGFPLVCLASWAALGTRRTGTGWRSRVVALSVPVLVFAAIPSIQALTTDPLTLRQHLTHHLDSFGFVADRSEWVALWQTTTFLEFFREESGDFSERLLSPDAWTSLGPSLLTLLLFMYASFRIRVFSTLSIMLLGVVAAPLAMHAVAWDYGRISTYTIGSAFIALWILAETQRAWKAPRVFFALAILVSGLNALTRMPLMDDEVERFSDVTRLLIYLPSLGLLVFLAARDHSPPRMAEFTSQETLPERP